MKKVGIILTDYSAEKMKTKQPAVMCSINFRPMLEYVVNAAAEICDKTALLCTAENEAAIKEYFGDRVSYARCSSELEDITSGADTIVWLRGDIPCITASDIRALYSSFTEGREQPLCGAFITAASYDFKKACGVLDSAENTCDSRAQAAKADREIRLGINNYHMENGVTVINPEDTYIEAGVKIGADTVIYPGAIIKGDTELGEGCVIMGGCMIEDSRIGDNVSMKASTVLGSKIGSNTTVGPYAYVRPGSEIGNNVKIGDFVEVKKSVIGDGTKISHLTYVGDSKVGKNVNFGCGTVTVNYDGKNKFVTEIGDNAFIGCNTNLVSPVKVGDNAFIAAGSTITDEVPENGFAIARQRQTVKEGWVKPKDRK